jgi:hypothetical protein
MAEVDCARNPVEVEYRAVATRVVEQCERAELLRALADQL